MHQLREIASVELDRVPSPGQLAASENERWFVAVGPPETFGLEAQGFGWSYGDKPTFVLTSRDLPRIRDTIEFHAGDLAQFVNGSLRPTFRSIWVVGGGMVSAECLRLGLADEVRYSILPILIGDGIPFFDNLDRDIALHLAEVKACRSGMVELRYEVRGHRGESRNVA